MVVGVIGRPVVQHVDQESGIGPAQIQRQQMGGLSVADLPIKLVTRKNHVLGMVDGVLGEIVVNLVVLEFRQEHAQILLQHVEVLIVLDRLNKRVTQNHASVSLVQVKSNLPLENPAP